MKEKKEKLVFQPGDFEKKLEERKMENNPLQIFFEVIRVV